MSQENVAVDHAEFVRRYRAGGLAVLMEDAVARHLVENHPSMPRPYYNAHAFWTWVWMLTGVISLGLIPMVFGMRRAINKSAREFVVEHALESPTFYDEAVSKKWIRLKARS